jgi:hypothetical protein
MGKIIPFPLHLRSDYTITHENAAWHTPTGRPPVTMRRWLGQQGQHFARVNTLVQVLGHPPIWDVGTRGCSVIELCDQYCPPLSEAQVLGIIDFALDMSEAIFGHLQAAGATIPLLWVLDGWQRFVQHRHHKALLPDHRSLPLTAKARE